jgi:peptidylprolyl isomerase
MFAPPQPAERIMLALARILALVAALILSGGPVSAADLENTLYLDVPAGRVVIELRPDLAPHHVARIKELVRRGFYDGIVFHRVIDGFMAQTGDPRGNGTGGSGQNIDAEFSSEHHVRGTLSMARAQSPNSADSQFFICFAPAPFLDGKYTIWGQVASGMEFVDAIKRGEPPKNPDKIIKMQVAADAIKAGDKGK